MTVTRSSPPPPTGTIRRSLRDMLLGVVSAAVLLAAVVGIPLALTTTAPDLVNLFEAVNGLPDSLWRPDDGSLFMLALLAVASRRRSWPRPAYW
jgi:hypothetical protein